MRPSGRGAWGTSPSSPGGWQRGLGSLAAMPVPGSLHHASTARLLCGSTPQLPLMFGCRSRPQRCACRRLGRPGRPRRGTRRDGRRPGVRANALCRGCRGAGGRPRLLQSGHAKLDRCGRVQGRRRCLRSGGRAAGLHGCRSGRRSPRPGRPRSDTRKSRAIQGRREPGRGPQVRVRRDAEDIAVGPV